MDNGSIIELTEEETAIVDTLMLQIQKMLDEGYELGAILKALPLIQVSIINQI